MESGVGAHLRNAAVGTRVELFYWRERGREVDFVLRGGASVTALEVKSGRSPAHLPGTDAFLRAFGPARALLVGGGGIPLEEFLSSDPARWL